MNKLFNRILITIVVIFSFTACAPHNNVSFSTYSQQERQEYIQNYLKENYGFNDCRISEVKHKQINVLQNEDYYFATATTLDDDIISVWVSKDGKITDSAFLLDMQNELENHFKVLINKWVSHYRLKVYTEMRDIPTKKWTNEDNIDDFLRIENAYSIIRIFVDESESVTEDMIQSVKESLNGYDGCLYVHKCSNVDQVNLDTYDFSSYLYYEELKEES